MRINFFLLLFILLIYACTPKKRPQKCLKVKASAYNSVPYQTRPGSSGMITAWGDTLVDSIPSIAISRDLLDSGLIYGTLVNIQGYDELFVVNDKMNRRYLNRIDIHMGRNVKKARKFGVKKVEICWDLPLDTVSSTKR